MECNCKGYRTDLVKCSGSVKEYRVQGNGFNCKFHYCEAHAEYDRHKGFRVTEIKEGNDE